MKKFLAVLLASAVSVGTFAFVGCGDKSSGDNSAELTKPTMPTDSNMQTVEQKNIYKEFGTFYDKMKESLSGKYRAYECGKEVIVNNGEHQHYDGENWLETAEKANYTAKTVVEVYDDYASINEKGTVTGAVTNQVNRSEENKVDSKNPNLAYLNKNSHEKRRKTGIQKGNQLYKFSTYEMDEDGQTEKIDKHLSRYIDNSDGAENIYSGVIPCLQVTMENDWQSPLAISVVSGYIYYADYYITNNDDRFLTNLHDDETLALSEKTELKNFEFAAKKNDKKFFASLKYSVEYTFSSAVTKNVDCEFAVLFDLGETNGVTSLPSDGINLNNLSLSTAESKLAYPDVTSEQLTNAVKEGKEITVNVAGGGDVEKLVITTISDRDILPVVDGKVTIDGAELKAYVDETKKIYEEMGLSNFPSITLNFEYYYEDNYYLTGRIYINY